MAYSNIFSIPVFRKHQLSMRRRLIVFSSVLFLFIFILGSAAFIILMKQIQHKNTGYELIRTVETERLKLEASVSTEIAIVLKMAGSPLIRRHFLNPADGTLQKIAFEEIAGYRKALAGNSVFWVSDVNKNFFFNDAYIYTVNTADPNNYWYLTTLNETEKYNCNINYNPGLNITNLWINAPVFNSQHRPVGIVGTGVNLSDFINAIYQNYTGTANLYFFNAVGEITAAKDVNLAENKVNITEAIGQIGGEILAGVKGLGTGEIKYFKTKDKRQITAVGSIPALNWYITAVLPVAIGDFLRTGMTVLFGVMITIVFAVFVAFNIFVVGMLGPLNSMVKKINQTLYDWELQPREDNHHDEIVTLGEFLNMTVIDQLTGIYNRRYMDGHLKKMIKSLSRTDSTLSLLLIDIDYFKRYNDTYGHDAGDNCLKAVANALSQCILRDTDFVARYGGEEFVIVLPNTGKNGAQVVADRLLRKVQECNIPHEASDAANHVTVSIGGTTGVVKHLQHGSDYIKSADKALYESKKNGRNRYTFNDFEGRTDNR